MDWLLASREKAVDSENPRHDRKPWVVLIVDDEEGIHAVTKLALRDFVFNSLPLEFLDAYSGKEAIEIARERDDIAVIIMDVVMDSDSDGLDAIEVIRNDIKNYRSRIILRTGHPGQAPENDIIRKYDIDDYKEKTELTKKRLFTSIYVAIRSYRDLRALERNRQGLENVIKGSTELLHIRGIGEFAEGVLTQMSTLLHASSNGFFVRDHGFASLEDKLEPAIVAATGKFEPAVRLSDIKELDEGAYSTVMEKIKEPGSKLHDTWFAHCIESPSKRRLLLYIESTDPWTSLDRQVLDLFSHNVAVALDNLYLNRQVLQTQEGLILMLGEAIEMRSMEAGQHVHRVAEYSALLGELVGMPAEEVETLRMAAPLHDIGKIAIEDSILNKPGRHTPAESERMQEHAAIGAKILSGHKLPILDAAFHVAEGHHENWDGSGYPHGKSGEDIHIYGRIVALTDVFDALRSDRCYKKAWSLEKTLEFIREQRGIKFDPQLVDLLCDNLERFDKIATRLPD